MWHTRETLTFTNDSKQSQQTHGTHDSFNPVVFGVCDMDRFELEHWRSCTISDGHVTSANSDCWSFSSEPR